MISITINAKNRTIELNKAFTKAASIFGSEEYRQLQEARRDYPNYRVVTLKQKCTSNADFAKLSFSFMDKYIANHDVSDDFKAEYRSLRGLDENGIAADFQTIKDWFLNTFPEFEDFHNERKALLDKIKNEKAARLAARKKVA